MIISCKLKHCFVAAAVIARDYFRTNIRRVAEISLFGFLFIFAIMQGVRFGGDTRDYINAREFRSPGYVLILKLYDALIGQDFRILIVLQIAVGIIACVIFARFFVRSFNLPPWLRVCIALFLLIPYFMRPYAIGNTVQSEAITFPLYLLLLGLLIKGLISRTVLPLYRALPVLILLILVRKQLLFALPAIPLIGTYLAHLNATRWRTAGFLLLATIASMLVAEIIERTYTYASILRFESAPYLGVQLLNAPLYFSTEIDAELFAPGSIQRKYFEEFRRDLKDKGALYESYDDQRITAEHYVFHYDAAYMTIWKLLLGHFGGRDDADWFKLDDISRALAFPLMRRHFVQIAALDLHKLKFHYGGYYAVLAWVTAGLGGLYLMWQRRATIAVEFFMLALVLSVINSVLLATLVVFITRYTMYTESFLYLSVLLVIWSLWRTTARAEASSK